MGDFSEGQDRFLKQLISNYRCQRCRRPFERDRVRISARHERLWIVSVRCAHCRSQQMFWVQPKDEEEDGEDVLRDVSSAEAARFAEMEPVTSNEILDMHEFLAEFDGDFKGLFTRR